MPFPMKIQPIDFNTPEESIRFESVKPVVKSRFKRLFERQFSSVLKITVPEKAAAGTGVGGDEPQCDKDSFDEFELSSVCLDKMVQNFMEESNDKQPKCGRNRCNCFNCNGTETSDEEANSFNCFGELNSNSSLDACDTLKSLVPCACVTERNLLADTSKIVEKNKICKRKDGFCRKIVTDGLLALGYDASICKSRWEKSPSFPAGEYEYVDVIFGGHRMIIDIDFRSEFEIARSTKAYKSILQVLPNIFVGKADRLQRIISIVSEAAKQSLKKKGMHFPPWRKAEYVKAKWLSPHTRTAPPPPTPTTIPSLLCVNSTGKVSCEIDTKINKEDSLDVKKGSSGEVELVFGERVVSAVETDDIVTFTDVFNMFNDSGDDEEKTMVGVKQLGPPENKPKISQGGIKISSGLASVMEN